MLKELFTDNGKAFRSCLFFAMCFLTLFCIAAVMKNDAFRDDTTYTVVVTDLFCLVFLTILSGYCFLKGEAGAVGAANG